MRAEDANRTPFDGLTAFDRGPLEDEFADHRDKIGMRARCRHPGEAHAEFTGGLRGLGVEVEDDFHVVGNEADRNNHDGGRAAFVQFAQLIADVGFQPWHLRWTRP